MKRCIWRVRLQYGSFLHDLNTTVPLHSRSPFKHYPGFASRMKYKGESELAVLS